MNAYRRLALGLGWVSAAFVVHTAVSMLALGGYPPLVAFVYALAVAATFALHARTRGPLLLSLAFGVCVALAVEGLYLALVDDGAPLARRGIGACALMVPLVLLVVRRSTLDADDAWFAEHARRVAQWACLVALPLSLAGIVGSKYEDPAPYERARRALGYEPLASALFHTGVSDPSASRRRWELFQSTYSGVSAAVRDEVNQACGSVTIERERRSACAHDFVAAKSHGIRARHALFSRLSLLSALPWAVAALFAWRGRRERPEVHAGADGVSDG